MQCFPFGLCSACLPPPSGCVSPWESAFGAFVQELFNFARGERERNVDKELLLKVKYHGPVQVQVLFFFSVNLPRCQLLALSARPLADLGQTQANGEVIWPARSQKAECLIPRKFLLFSLKTVFLFQRQFPSCLNKRYAYFDVYSVEKGGLNLCSDCSILLMLSNGSVTGVEENQSYYHQAELHCTGILSPPGKFSVSHIFRKDEKSLLEIVICKSWNNSSYVENSAE